MLQVPFWTLALLNRPKSGTRPVAEAVILGLANYAGYVLWDGAMRNGNLTLVVSASYLTPLLSTMISCIYLGVVPRESLWAGCILLIVGSVVSWHATRSAPAAPVE